MGLFRAIDSLFTLFVVELPSSFESYRCKLFNSSWSENFLDYRFEFEVRSLGFPIDCKLESHAGCKRGTTALGTSSTTESMEIFGSSMVLCSMV